MTSPADLARRLEKDAEFLWRHLSVVLTPGEHRAASDAYFRLRDHFREAARALVVEPAKPIAYLCITKDGGARHLLWAFEDAEEEAWLQKRYASWTPLYAHPAPAVLEQARNAALEEAAQVAIHHPSNIVRGHHIIADAIRALSTPSPKGDE